ncbi:MAG: response regulator transcription factor [Vulcanimicrobiota bacterium]
MIRVMLVDDHEMVRSGLRTAIELEDDMEVVAEAASGEECLEMLPGTAVDVILMDVMMEGLGGVEACRLVKERGATPRVLMLTSSSDEQAVLSSLVAGANGYMLKNVGREELLRSIRATNDGQTTLDQRVAATVTKQLMSLARGESSALSSQVEDNPLSERELEVVGLIAQGKTNKEIADSLIIAEKTARNHVSRILTKLGLTRRSQAAAWAIKAGLQHEI